MKIKDGFVLEKVGSSYLAVAVGDAAKSFKGLVRMNETGAFMWNIIKENDKTREELIESLLKEYDAPRELLERDVISFENQLRGAGIIE
ncbi:MAG: PqqD family protein [Clostridia bacterium]|nr:PqqD family protein [Clostridia bacterium]